MERQERRRKSDNKGIRVQRMNTFCALMAVLLGSALLGLSGRIRKLNGMVQGAEELQKLLTVHTVLTAGLVIVAVIIVFVNIFQIVIPLGRFAVQVKTGEEMPMTGAYELKELAETYNMMLEENRRNHELLSYEATHDALTGLYNRGAFENVRSHIEEKRDNTLLILDVDEFKMVNDTWGHEIGDRVLQRVGFCLMKEFRSEDMACRIGGDEFAVVMRHTGRGLKPALERKLEGIREKLSVPEGDLPAVTLSIGVAFGDRLNGTGNIYKDADAALYEVKNRGGNGIAFCE